MELEYRPECYYNYKNGIKTVDFLLDIINYMAGYHDLNNHFENPNKNFV